VSRRIEALIYDFGGVFVGSPFGAIRAYETRLGVDEGAVSSLLFGASYVHGEGDGDAEHDWHRLEKGQITMAEWFEGVQLRAVETLPGVDLDLGAAFSSGSGTAISWEMVHHVRRMKQRGLATAILTNNVKEYGGWWRSAIPLDEIIDIVVDSCEEGMRKPEPEIYLRTAERLAVDPAACVFADDLAENVDAARAVGMVGVHVPADVSVAILEIEQLLDT
jgi:epoxide hydrolase-like predicted phosphatase